MDTVSKQTVLSAPQIRADLKANQEKPLCAVDEVSTHIQPHTTPAPPPSPAALITSQLAAWARPVQDSQAALEWRGS